MNDPAITRIMIIDDHPAVHSGLNAIICGHADLHIVAHALSAKEALANLGSASANVVLVDLGLPDANGIDLMMALSKVDAKAHFLVLTTRMGGTDILRSLNAGAHAYLFKDSSGDEIIAAIRTVARGGRFIPAAVGKRADSDKNDSDLTARERYLLIWIARGKSNEQIGAALGISDETVKSHMKKVFKKFGVTGRNEVVALCVRAGLVHTEDL